MDEKALREILRIMVQSAEQIVFENMVMRLVLLKAQGFSWSMVEEAMRDPLLLEKLHAEFEPLYKALERPEDFYNALKQFLTLRATEKLH